MVDRIAKQTTGVEVAVYPFHSFCLQILRDHILESGIAMHAGVIPKANQLVWGLRNIDAFGLAAMGHHRPSRRRFGHGQTASGEPPVACHPSSARRPSLPDRLSTATSRLVRRHPSRFHLSRPW